MIEPNTLRFNSYDEKTISTWQSGGQGIRTGGENTGETDNSENRETRRTRSSQLPEFEALVDEALSELIDLWPNLSPAAQSRIYELATSEVGKQPLDASGMRGAE